VRGLQGFGGQPYEGNESMSEAKCKSKGASLCTSLFSTSIQSVRGKCISMCSKLNKIILIFTSDKRKADFRAVAKTSRCESE
jgi:hypothetical protein